MKTCKEWFEQLMQERKLSAYAAGKLIGLTTSAAYNYTSGERAFDNYTAARVAELLGVDPVLVIASAEAERTKDADRRAYWERLGGTAAAVALVWIMVGPVADPSPALAFLSDDSGRALCIMFNQAAASNAFTVQCLSAALLAFFLALQTKIDRVKRPRVSNTSPFQK